MKPLKFSEKLWGDREVVMTEMVQSSKKALDETVKYVQGKRSMFKSSAKHHRKLIKQMKFGSLERYGSTVQKSNEVIRTMEERTGGDVADWYEQMLENSFERIETQRSDYSARAKTLFGEMHRVDKETKELYAKLVKTKNRYYKSCEEYESAKAELDEILVQPEVREEQLQQANERTKSKYRDTLKTNEAYIQAIKATRTQRHEGDRRICKVLDAFQKLEMERLVQTRHCLEDYFQLEVARMRSIQSELESALSHISSNFDPERDLQEFIEFNASDVRPIPLPEYEEHPLYQNEEVKNDVEEKEDQKSNEDHRLDTVWDQFFGHMYNCSSHCSCGWNSDPFPILQEFKGRSSFASILNLQRANNGGLLSSEDHFKVLGDIMLACLDNISEARDSSQADRKLLDSDLNVAKVIMIISQSLYLEEDSGKLFVKEHIQDHSLWSDIRFWEEMFFEAYCVEVGHQRVYQVERWMSEEEQAAIGAHNQNVLFGQLSSFAHSMALFQIEKQSIHNFIFKMSRLHNLQDDMMQQLFSLIQ